MPLYILPFAEKLVIDYLKTVDELTDLVGTKGVSTTKAAPYPRVSVTRIGGGDGTIPHHLDPVRLQFDCWGSGQQQQSQPDTHNLAQVVKAAMFAIVDAEHDEGVVTDARCVLGPVWQPDPQTNRDRYLVDFLIQVHPVLSS